MGGPTEWNINSLCQLSVKTSSRRTHLLYSVGFGSAVGMLKPIALVMSARDRSHTKVWVRSSLLALISTVLQTARGVNARNLSQDQLPRADQQPQTTTQLRNLPLDLRQSRMPIASLSESGLITASKTRTLDHPFPKTTQIGVRLPPRAKSAVSNFIKGAYGA